MIGDVGRWCVQSQGNEVNCDRMYVVIETKTDRPAGTSESPSDRSSNYYASCCALCLCCPALTLPLHQPLFFFLSPEHFLGHSAAKSFFFEGLQNLCVTGGANNGGLVSQRRLGRIGPLIGTLLLSYIWASYRPDVELGEFDVKQRDPATHCTFIMAQHRTQVFLLAHYFSAGKGRINSM